MMRRLASLLLLVALAVVGYNYYQVSRMRQDMQALTEKVRVLQEERRVSEDTRLPRILVEVRRHTVRARAFLARGETTRAKTELDKSLRLIERASKLSGGVDEGFPSNLEGAWAKIRSELEKAWKDMTSQSKVKHGAKSRE